MVTYWNWYWLFDGPSLTERYVDGNVVMHDAATKAKDLWIFVRSVGAREVAVAIAQYLHLPSGTSASVQ